jgi:hypothetical protein
MVPNWNLSCGFSSKEDWNHGLLKKHMLTFGWFQIGICLVNSQVKKNEMVVFFKILFLFFLNTVVVSTFFQYLLHQFVSHFSSIQCIWIQFKLHAMSFNIFIWMEFNFHKNNPICFRELSWLSFIVRNQHRAQVWIGFSEFDYKNHI